MIQESETPQEVIPPVPLLTILNPNESLDSPIERRSDYYRHKAMLAPHKPLPQPLMTIPNILTFIRLLLVPVLVFGWESKHRYSPLLCGICFIIASITDCFDGYLARRLKAVTVFGAFLDPVADKVMVATALILLSVSPPQPLTPQQMTIPVMMIICREITMSSLREWAAAAGGAASKAVKVNTLGKWKTALQMASMSVLLVVRQPGGDLSKRLEGSKLPAAVAVAAFWGLWAGTLLAVWSLAIYMTNVWHHFIYPESARGAVVPGIQQGPAQKAAGKGVQEVHAPAAPEAVREKAS